MLFRYKVSFKICIYAKLNLCNFHVAVLTTCAAIPLVEASGAYSVQAGDNRLSFTKRYGSSLPGCRSTPFVWYAVQTTSEIVIHWPARCPPVAVIVREYVFYVFWKSKNATFYVFWSVLSKNVESIVQVFTFSTLKLLTNIFTVKQLHTRHVIHTTLY